MSYITKFSKLSHITILFNTLQPKCNVHVTNLHDIHSKKCCVIFNPALGQKVMLSCFNPKCRVVLTHCWVEYKHFLGLFNPTAGFVSYWPNTESHWNHEEYEHMNFLNAQIFLYQLEVFCLETHVPVKWGKIFQMGFTKIKIKINVSFQKGLPNTPHDPSVEQTNSPTISDSLDTFTL